MADDETPSGMRLSDTDKRALVASTRRFDLRRILGALFLFYGIVVLIVGIANNTQDLAKTHGIAINLWTGGAMLVLGALFLIWDRLSPVPEEDILKNEESEPDANASAREAMGE